MAISRSSIPKQISSSPLKKGFKVLKGNVVKTHNGGAVTRAKRPSSNPNIARGCGVVMSGKRKATKYS